MNGVWGVQWGATAVRDGGQFATGGVLPGHGMQLELSDHRGKGLWPRMHSAMHGNSGSVNRTPSTLQPSGPRRHSALVWKSDDRMACLTGVIWWLSIRCFTALQPSGPKIGWLGRGLRPSPVR